MFTGLVEELGTLARLELRGPGRRAFIHTTLGRANAGRASEPLVLGESISVNGVCLTVDRVIAEGFEADVSTETVARSTLGSLSSGARVNLERATPLGARMGGHVVLGHVDGIATLVESKLTGDAREATFALDASLAPFIAEKGSIAIEGVSLTVNSVEDRASGTRFSVMLIPHTMGKTTLDSLRVSSRANIEVDVLARYVQRQLQTGARHPSRGPGEAAADDPDGGRDDPRTDDERLLEKLRRSGYA